MIKRAIFNLRQWWKQVRRPPAVFISRSGQLTPRPQVHVSVAGINGIQGVYTWDANEQGEACATMYGQSLAHITQLRLIDERIKEKNSSLRSSPETA